MHTQVPAPLLCPSSSTRPTTIRETLHDNLFWHHWIQGRVENLSSQHLKDFHQLHRALSWHYFKCQVLEFKPGEFIADQDCVQSLLDPLVIIGHQSRLPALQRAVSQDSQGWTSSREHKKGGSPQNSFSWLSLLYSLLIESTYLAIAFSLCRFYCFVIQFLVRANGSLVILTAGKI